MYQKWKWKTKPEVMKKLWFCCAVGLEWGQRVGNLTPCNTTLKVTHLGQGMRDVHYVN